MLNKLEDRELSLNLLSSLQAGEETMIREREQADNEEEVEDVEKLIAILIKLIDHFYFQF